MKVPHCAPKRFTRFLRQKMPSPIHVIISWIVSFLPFTYLFNISEVAQFPHKPDFAALSLLLVFPQ